MDKEKLKNLLKLDQEVEEKLSKILKNKKN